LKAPFQLLARGVRAVETITADVILGTPKKIIKVAASQISRYVFSSRGNFP
jgi:hypothetical protein